LRVVVLEPCVEKVYVKGPFFHNPLTSSTPALKTNPFLLKEGAVTTSERLVLSRYPPID